MEQDSLSQLLILNQKYTQLLHHLQEGILITNPQGFIQLINPAAEQTLQQPAAELLLTSVNTLFDSSSKVTFEDILNMCFEKQEHYHNQVILKSHTTQLIPISLTAFLTHDHENKIDGMVLIFTDLTELKANEEKLSHNALNDPLTKLPNRAYFEKNLTQAIARARRVKRLVGLLILDLDQFKNINTRVGHHTGDLLLIGVTNRLTSCIRENDTFARIGGDEFAIILDQILDEHDVIKIAEKILHVLETPFYLSGEEISLSACIGIAIYPNSAKTAVLLSKNADLARYQAKQLGPKQCCIYNEGLSQEVKLRLQVSDSLKYALHRNEFELYYQPKVDLYTKQIVGVEALLRWNHPHLGLLSPEKFIDIAEKSDLIDSITRWVIEEACHLNANWQKADILPCAIAINLSSLQLEQPNIVQTIRQIIAANGIDTSLFEIELTETSLIDSTEKTLTTLHTLHNMGIVITIDDFGTGYSSLSYLKKLPISKVKIDQEFIRDIGPETHDTTIIKAIIMLAHSLGLKVIAEGVETIEQLKFLQENNCDQIQGYYISNPLTKEALETFLIHYDADHFF